MEEAWEKAVAAAAGGQAEPRALTLDGAVKCANGRLPPRALLELFKTLEHLSIANVRLASLEGFPRLPSLRRLILSDNRIAGGLDALVEAGLDALRDLDLSNNRIQSLEELAPLAKLRLVSLDLYECPVTKSKDYQSKVFGMMGSLKYLDKMDAEGNERLDSDDEDEDEEDEEDDDGDDVGNVDVANGSGRGARPQLENGSGGVEEEEDDEDLGEEVDVEDECDEEVGEEGEDEQDGEDGEEVEDAGTGSTEKITNVTGGIDGHEQGKDDGKSEEEEELLAVPAVQPKDGTGGDICDEVSSQHKRKKDGNLDDGSVDDSRPSKHH